MTSQRYCHGPRPVSALLLAGLSVGTIVLKVS